MTSKEAIAILKKHADNTSLETKEDWDYTEALLLGAKALEREVSEGVIGPAATETPYTREAHIETLYAAYNRLEKRVEKLEGRAK